MNRHNPMSYMHCEPVNLKPTCELVQLYMHMNNKFTCAANL